jgi:hypothetical protein
MRFYHRVNDRSGVSYGFFGALLLSMIALIWLFVIAVVYATIGLAALAGGAYLAWQRPDLGGFRRHTAAMWRGLTARLR